MVDAVLLILVYAALFNLLSMLCANKAAAAVISMGLIFGFLMLASGLLNLLSQPEMGERKLLQFLADFLPTGQGFQLAGQMAVHPAAMALYSLGIIAAATGVGIWLFEKKDLK